MRPNGVDRRRRRPTYLDVQRRIPPTKVEVRI